MGGAMEVHLHTLGRSSASAVADAVRFQRSAGPDGTINEKNEECVLCRNAYSVIFEFASKKGAQSRTIALRGTRGRRLASHSQKSRPGASAPETVRFIYARKTRKFEELKITNCEV